MHRLITILLIVEFLGSPLALAEDLASNNFIIRNPTVDNSGGGWSTSDNFQSFDILGQPVIDRSTSAGFEGQSGFGYVQDPVFTVEISSTIIFTAITAQFGSQQSSATITSIDVTDTRGIGSGWDLTIDTTNLTMTGNAIKLTGANDTVTFSGTYTGATRPNKGGVYYIEITESGTLGVAKFKWTEPDGTIHTDITTAASVALNNGISALFGAANYTTGDQWMLVVDSYAYTEMNINPGAITAIFGSANGVAAGTEGSFAGMGATSNAYLLMNAASGSGEGKYRQSPALTQTIHELQYVGQHQGTITVTLISG